MWVRSYPDEASMESEFKSLHPYKGVSVNGRRAGLQIENQLKVQQTAVRFCLYPLHKIFEEW